MLRHKYTVALNFGQSLGKCGRLEVHFMKILSINCYYTECINHIVPSVY